MGLGNNRDYKTRADAAREGLSTHYAYMKMLLDLDLDEETASRIAFELTVTRSRRKRIWGRRREERRR